MGCWNETCGISNLTIKSGDKVRLVIIQQMPDPDDDSHASGFCHIDDLYKPRFLPIKGKYDDYGSIEGVVEDLNTKIIETDLTASLIERAPKHQWDKGVQRADAKLSVLLEWIERGRLKIKDYDDYDREVQLGHMFVLEDVYKHLVSYGGEHLRNDPWITDNVLGGLLGPVNSFSSSRNSNYIYNEALDKLGIKVKFSGRFIMDGGEDDPVVAPLREESIEFFKFMIGMSALRKPFAPQTGKGGQDDNGEPLLALNEVIQKIVTKREG